MTRGRLPAAILAAAALLAGLIPGPAKAWDAEGHRIVAEIAWSQMTPKARAGAAALIARSAEQATPACPVASLEDASVWPDCVRADRARFGSMAPLHYEDEPLCGPPDPARQCPEGRCLTAAIDRAMGVLGDPARPPAERLEALEEVTHFVGDLHQPLHAADNGDRGGNEIKVTVEGRSENLHWVWDTDVVRAAVGPDAEAGAAALAPLAAANRKAWSRGGLHEWFEESHALAVSYVYARLAQAPACGVPAPAQALSPAYIAGAAPLVRIQLARAGVRLAVLLNAALGR